MIFPYRCIASVSLALLPALALAAFEVNELPKVMAPLHWEISRAELAAYAKPEAIRENSYTSWHIDRYVTVQSNIVNKRAQPFFADAQISIERFEGRIISLRILTNDLDTRCWTEETRPKTCRRDDLEGLTKLFARIANALEQQYGPGTKGTAEIRGEQSLEWKSRDGHLTLFLNKAEYDGWAVGVWLHRH